MRIEYAISEGACVPLIVFAFVFVCVASLAYRDNLVALGKASRLSAAVVFLPQHTLHFGKHGEDRCYCVEVGVLTYSVFAHAHSNRSLRLSVSDVRRDEALGVQGKRQRMKEYSY